MDQIVWRLSDYEPYPISKEHPQRKKMGRPARYPWRRLAVGAGFTVPSWRFQSAEKMWNSLTSCRANAERKTGHKFTLMRVYGGIRWIRLA